MKCRMRYESERERKTRVRGCVWCVACGMGSQLALGCSEDKQPVYHSSKPSLLKHINILKAKSSTRNRGKCNCYLLKYGHVFKECKKPDKMWKRMRLSQGIGISQIICKWQTARGTPDFQLTNSGPIFSMEEPTHKEYFPTSVVSRPQLKSDHLEERVLSNNSQGKKQEVEDPTLVISKYHSIGSNWNLRLKVRNVKPPLGNETRNANISEHMTPRCSTLSNTPLSSNSFAARTVKFGNDQITPILGYGDLVQGTITIKRVYYVEGLNHNLFSVGQFCDADLEVAFRKSTCYIRDLKGNDLLIGSHGTDLYLITLQDTPTPNSICLMAKATSSQAWLWHGRLSHLNFDTINVLLKNNIVNVLLKLKFVKHHLCSSCELGKAKRKSFHTKTTPSSKRWLQLLHMDLCGAMQEESINGKKYVLVIVDDYSRYTWNHFLRSKDETPEVLIDFLTLMQRGLHAQVRTDKGTEFLNKTLHAYFAKEGIRHETSTAQTPEQNGIVERQNRTLVEAARTMLSAAKVPLFFWAEAIATTCFTQNRSLVIPCHEKTPYHIINARKPSVKFFHIFGSPCYIVRDSENLDKMKEIGDACIFVRWRQIMYGYIKNYKKTVKNGQARTRKSEEYKKKPKIQSRSQKSQTR
ncbi:retrovirus-related pol polyprotein from transposon TNT 1-94, partial [Tanacetum coccineum]